MMRLRYEAALRGYDTKCRAGNEDSDTDQASRTVLRNERRVPVETVTRRLRGFRLGG
jgi:hypothetical protein